VTHTMPFASPPLTSLIRLILKRPNKNNRGGGSYYCAYDDECANVNDGYGCLIQDVGQLNLVFSVMATMLTIHPNSARAILKPCYTSQPVSSRPVYLVQYRNRVPAMI
jgi:hypothetical protein